MKRIEVAVGIVFNNKRQVLVGQRVVKDQYYKKWEFPGGKLEQNESAEDALIRELKEELSIDVKNFSDLMLVDHDYPDRQVRLHVFVVDRFSNEIDAAEGQAIRWVEIDQLNSLDFLQGNDVIIERLLDQKSKGKLSAEL